MVFKTASILMAPDGDPQKHRSTIKTDNIEQTTVICKIMDYDKIVDVCKDLVQNHGVQSITLCPGCTYDMVARVAKAVGEEVSVYVSRGDTPNVIKTFNMLKQEGWLPEKH